MLPVTLTTAASLAIAAIQRKIFCSGITTLIILSKELNAIIKIIKSFEDSGLLIKGITETFENEVKEQIGGFLGMLASTLGVSSLGNMLAGKRVIIAGDKG